MEKKTIIRNNNLLFQFSGHDNNLMVLKLWKSTRWVIIFNNAPRLSDKLYFFSCCTFFSNNFHMTFLLSDNSGLVSTPRQLNVVFSHKLNILRPDKGTYHNLKEVSSFEFRRKSSVSYTKRTLTKS